MRILRRFYCSALLVALTMSIPAYAQEDDGDDVFRGKLFAPEHILEHREALDLSREQYSAIRAAVVETQSGIAGYEWDLTEAYQKLLTALDASPIDADEANRYVEQALDAENEVKKAQVRLLVNLRNLLSEEQVVKLRRLTQ